MEKLTEQLGLSSVRIDEQTKKWMVEVKEKDFRTYTQIVQMTLKEKAVDYFENKNRST